MIRRIVLAVSMLALGTAEAVRAQTINGDVVETTGRTSVGRGFVLLLGPDGNEIGRVLTDASGRFTIKAPAAGRYRLRSERIGFKVTTSPAIEVGQDQTLEYHLEVSAIPIRLEEIRVAGETKCRVRPEEGRATATVWDEARKALAAVSWVQRQRLRVRHRTYSRYLSTDFTVTSEESRIRAGTAIKVYTALPAKELSGHGYIQKDPDGGLVFNGPDADVLFSDEFLNEHCFRLVPAVDTLVNLVGLGFEPTGGGNHSDIKGVMWLDGKSAELKFVDFTYTGFTFPAETDVAGGRVEFQRLSNGGWIVSRFRIRMPVFTYVKVQRFNSISDVTRNGTRSETQAELSNIKEEGGEVLEVFGGDGSPLVLLQGAVLMGTVFDSIRSVPLIGARVILAGTPYEAVTGPGGEFRMAGLPEGEYTLALAHPDFPQWGELRVGQLVKLRREQVALAELAVPSRRNLFRMICPTASPDTTGAVAGLVKDSTSRPVRDAVIQFWWKSYQAVGTTVVEGGRIGVEVGSDSAGHFRACGVPVLRTIEARIVIGDREGPFTALQVEPGEVKELNLIR